MTLSRRNPISKAFMETANLVALTILLLPSYLTSAYWLGGIGLTLEVAYLGWASRSKHYAARLEARERSIKAGVKPMDPLNPWLLVVTVAGFIVIFFFGFGKHLLNHPYPSLTHAEGWEVGAIIWTAIFLLYYAVKFRISNRPYLDKVVLLGGALCVYPMLRAALESMRNPIKHVFWVWLIGLFLFVIDWLIVKYHPDDEERKRAKASLSGADTPMVITFLVLIGYLWRHPDTENPDVFVSGVVACQLLISNAIFVVMEFGLLRSSDDVGLDKPESGQKEGTKQVRVESKHRYIAALLFASIFITSTAFLLARAGGLFHTASDAPTWIAVFTAVVSFISAASTVILNFLKERREARKDRRETREHELRIAQLERELEAAREMSALPASNEKPG